ncbi:hypothetical protein HPB52_000824 [Rhipicephalus sanguineus]|uniref:ATP-dependent DNA helicase n=1 Tax=Rhipicephalus sanguineus TaxID=34632 RepID=A0A9D4SVA5_RHISA|nr:hypothetical protein HPB52_000824 [Rhipicephalus sanguineus]
MGDGGLRPSDLNTFRCAFRRVKCVIIDEVRMMSADQLKLVDCRLRQITQRLTEPFGGLDVILCGDLRQLPPVLLMVSSDSPLSPGIISNTSH